MTRDVRRRARRCWVCLGLTHLRFDQPEPVVCDACLRAPPAWALVQGPALAKAGAP